MSTGCAVGAGIVVLVGCLRLVLVFVGAEVVIVVVVVVVGSGSTGELTVVVSRRTGAATGVGAWSPPPLTSRIVTTPSTTAVTVPTIAHRAWPDIPIMVLSPWVRGPRDSTKVNHPIRRRLPVQRRTYQPPHFATIVDLEKAYPENGKTVTAAGEATNFPRCRCIIAVAQVATEHCSMSSGG